MADRFYRRWILANAAAEGLGLGTTLVLGVHLGQALDQRPSPAAVLLGALGAVVLGTVLEGVLVGLFQAWALRDRWPGMPAGEWTAATAVGAGIAWLLGMVPSTALALLPGADAPAAGPPAEPPAWARYTLAALMGAVLGPVLGLAQARVLRRLTARPLGWLWANAGAWAVGMPLIFAGMDAVPWGGGVVPLAAAVVAVCAGAGAAVGAIHGVYLRRVLPAARQAEPSAAADPARTPGPGG